MTYAARHLDPRPWHNRLPVWILADDAKRPQRHRLKASHWRTLQAIADRCDAPDAAGNLAGAFGGGPLAESAGCSLRSLWNHVNRLERLGYVITLGRGGTIGRRNYGNIYGVPGLRGALDYRRARRRMQQMVAGDDGRHRPHIIEPGEQASIWLASSGGPTLEAEVSASPSCPSPPGPAGNSPARTASASKKLHGGSEKLHGGSEKLHGGSEKLHGGVVKSCTPPYSPHGSPLIKNHGAFQAGGGRSARRASVLGHVAPEDLTKTGRLLALFDRAVERGLIEQSEDGRLRFLAAAEHALRCADQNPAGMFASIVNGGRWLYITHADEEAAAARLREMHRGTRRPTIAPERPRPRMATELSPDARLVLAAQQVATRLKRDAFRLLQAQQGWTRERYDRAVHELEASR